MPDIEKIKIYLEDNLSKKRYTHSIGVAEEAVRLAEHYGADCKKAYIAGLVHDVAKEIPADKALDLIKNKYGAEVDRVTENTFKLMHGVLGTYMIQSEFGICDADILDAVRYHTTAKADMSLLTKIVYMADYIEPNRDFGGVDDLRKLAYEDLDKAIMVGIEFTITELIEKGSMLHLDTVDAYNYLLFKRGMMI